MVLATLCLVLVAGAARGQADGVISFADDESIAVVFESEADKPTKLVALTNHSDVAITVSFSTVLADGDAPVAADLVSVTAAPRQVAPNTTSWITLTFEGETSANLDGYLVVSAEPDGHDEKPLTVASDDAFFELSFRRVGPWELGAPAAVVLVATALSAILLIVRLLTGPYDWTRPMGDRKWSFSESWASTFTAAGAIFGTVLGAGVLPDDPDLIGKAQYAGLNVLFLSLIVMAGFIFDATRRRNGKGRVPSFFAMNFVLFTAVFGELLTLLVLTTDSAANLDSGTLTVMLRGLAAVGIVVLGVYGYRAIDEAYKAGTRTSRRKKRRVPPRRGAVAEGTAAPSEVDILDEDGAVPGQAETVELPLGWTMP